jgi:hypothetical protein
MRTKNETDRGRRLVLLVLPLLLVGAALLVVPAPPVHGYTICGSITIDYYKNSNDTDLVGACTIDCAGGETCWGTTTSYVKTSGSCRAC